MRYLLRCNSCGFSEESNILFTGACPKCKANLIINDTEEDTQITEELERKEQKMKKKLNREDVIITREQIRKFGRKKVWNSIEKIANPYHRVEERQLYTEALIGLEKE